MPGRVRPRGRGGWGGRKAPGEWKGGAPGEGWGPPMTPGPEDWGGIGGGGGGERGR